MKFDEKKALFGVVNPLLRSLYLEFQELSKKKPQDAVSKGKVKIVNRILGQTFSVLDDEPSRVFLDLLDEDDLPQNSDVVIMLGQAMTAMGQFRIKNKL